MDWGYLLCRQIAVGKGLHIIDFPINEGIDMCYFVRKDDLEVYGPRQDARLLVRYLPSECGQKANVTLKGHSLDGEVSLLERVVVSTERVLPYKTREDNL